MEQYITEDENPKFVEKEITTLLKKQNKNENRMRLKLSQKNSSEKPINIYDCQER